jgi:hypothetical protein
MSYVLATPELMSAAATDLAAIGSTLDAAHQVATNPTVALVPAAADEVSVGVAHLFSAQAQQFHHLAGKAAAFHDQFVQTLKTGAGFYSATEAAAAVSLQPAAASSAPAAAVPLDLFASLVNALLAAPGLILLMLFVVLPIIGVIALFVVASRLGLLGGA